MMDEDRFREILHEELLDQRETIFRTMGEAIGYNLGDNVELKKLRKDLWMLRRTRERSERFAATGEKIFFVLLWTAGITGFFTGMLYFMKDKFKGIIS